MTTIIKSVLIGAVASLVVTLAVSQAFTRDAPLTSSDSSAGGEDAGRFQLPASATNETKGMFEARKAVQTECNSVEPAICHQRAVALLEGDAGAAELERASDFLAEACARGFAQSCAAFGRPKPVEAAKPQYTPAGRRKGVEGIVIAMCTVPVDGPPRDCLILKSLPDLDGEVLASLSSSRYSSGTVFGHPVRMTYVFNFRFRLP